MIRAGLKFIEQVDRRSAAKFVQALLEEGTRSHNTVNKLVTRLVTIWNAFEVVGVYEGKNPWSKQTVRGTKSKRRAFTPEELEALLGASRGWVRDVIIVLLAHGMRVGEFFALKASDISDREITIRGGKTSAAARVIPIHSDTYEAVRNVTPNGERIRQGQFRAAWKRTMVRAGLAEKTDELVIHSLRKTFYSQRMQAHCPHMIIDEIVGHELPTLVGTYGSGYTFTQKKQVVEAVRVPKVAPSEAAV